MTQELVAQIEAALTPLELTFARVTLENGHCNILAVAPVFAELSLLKRQQYVLRAVKDFVSSGQVHAVNVKCLTEAQWEKDRLLYL